MLTLYLFPVLTAVIFYLLKQNGYTHVYALFLAMILAYLPSYIESIRLGQYDGYPWPAFQKLRFWRWYLKYFDAKIVVEEKLDNKQLYIFCCFPHGPLSVNHLLTMTDGCGMLSEH